MMCGRIPLKTNDNPASGETELVGRSGLKTQMAVFPVGRLVFHGPDIRRRDGNIGNGDCDGRW